MPAKGPLWLLECWLAGWPCESVWTVLSRHLGPEEDIPQSNETT